MDTKSRRNQSLGHAAAFAFLLVLAASSVGAVEIDGRPPRRDPVRSRQLGAMNVFLVNYGSTDFSAVQDALEASPADAGNPEIVSIALSLGNDYVGRFERFGKRDDLARALETFESVAARRDLWGGRARSGAVVAYLDLSVVRINGECDVSAFQDRIGAVWQTVRSLTAEEAALANDAEGLSESPSSAEDNAARAALYAWASILVSDDPRAEQWRANAGRIAARFSVDDCQSDETLVALSQATLGYELFGRELPMVLRRSATSRAPKVLSSCSGSVAVYQATEPVVRVEPGDTLAAAVHDSQVVAYILSEIFLRQFPPGSQCLDDRVDDPKRPPLM
jgi:outer membrane murein-binding lipoprotein Lpp